MKRRFSALILCLLCAAPFFGIGVSESARYTPESYAKTLGHELGHKLDEYERAIAEATWLWYNQKWKSEWDAERFEYAVEKGAANCVNPAMLTAAKAGKFGEDVLKALIVAAGDAAEAFSDWVERNAERYNKRTK